MQEALFDLQEQMDEDDSIIKGKYLFRVTKCEILRSAAQEQGALIPNKAKNIGFNVNKRASFN